ncbi:hypothetical protein BCR36DRAFT_467112 [Piromyces finnis]|uniref:TOG domain-containing protein n=1 Tax=Piromyces finnis TaxID=1754191 RepID=A0A1Y1VH50_9FUNG|nr:hypothetical protein BCR36DRAFT_467112 [Piromyces finnis]|eukprot:ORX56048.1 hypothetical protein BCR36DRAFT_467112 [Piromyces finnis]
MDETELIEYLNNEDFSKKKKAVKFIKDIFNYERTKDDNDNINLINSIKNIFNELIHYLNNNNNNNIDTIIIILDLFSDTIPILFEKYSEISLDITMNIIMPSLVKLWKITNNIIHEKLQNCIFICKKNVNNCKYFYSQLLKYGAINEDWKIRYKCIEYLTILINSDNINENPEFPLQPIIRVLINRLNDISEIVVNSAEFTLNRIINLIGEKEFLDIIGFLPSNQIQLFKKHENQCLKKERSMALSAPTSEGKNISKTIPLLKLRKKDLEIKNNDNIELLYDEKEETNSYEENNIYDNPMNYFLDINKYAINNDYDNNDNNDITNNYAINNDYDNSKNVINKDINNTENDDNATNSNNEDDRINDTINVENDIDNYYVNNNNEKDDNNLKLLEINESDEVIKNKKIKSDVINSLNNKNINNTDNQFDK